MDLVNASKLLLGDLKLMDNEREMKTGTEDGASHVIQSDSHSTTSPNRLKKQTTNIDNEIATQEAEEKY